MSVLYCPSALSLFCVEGGGVFFDCSTGPVGTTDYTVRHIMHEVFKYKKESN